MALAVVLAPDSIARDERAGGGEQQWELGQRHDSRIGVDGLHRASA
jgi:hypothetical protein